MKEFINTLTSMFAISNATLAIVLGLGVFFQFWLLSRHYKGRKFSENDNGVSEVIGIQEARRKIKIALFLLLFVTLLSSLAFFPFANH